MSTVGDGSKSSVLTRTLCVQISGNLSQLAMSGPQAATWSLMDKKAPEVFGLTSEFHEEDGDLSGLTNQLRTALIHEVNVLEHKSTFPVLLGVHINCIPAGEFTDLGEKFSYTVLPQSTISTPQTVYSCNTNMSQGTEWRAQFPKYNNNNLESEGVMPIPNSVFKFVNQEHPAIALLRANPHYIGCDVDTTQKFDHEWYKVSAAVLAACCTTLRQKVLSKVTSHDLNTFSVQLHRIGATSWEDLGDGTTAMQGFKIKGHWTEGQAEEAQRRHLQAFAETPYSYIARLQVKYEVQQQP